jgi:thiamine-phosphate pyrophosphorylase
VSGLAEVRVIAITDRRIMAPGALEACAADAVQVREKDLDGGALLEMVRRVRVRAIVNDRVDVALAAGAWGVHLPERGMDVETARRVAPGLVIGCSRHSVADAEKAFRDGASYVQLGPIWETPGKGPALGLEALKEMRWVRARGYGFVVAVGGIESSGQAGDAVQAGADAVAVIRAAWTGAWPLASFASAVEMTRNRPLP